MFSSKWIFRAIFSIAGVAVLWMGINFSTKFIIHKKFAEYVQGTPIHWGVLSLSPDTHKIYVHYYFPFQGDSHSAQYIFPKPIFKSREAAEIGIEGKKTPIVEVWFVRRDNPLSILENHFPYNELIRFMASAVILAYFYFLRGYLSQFSRSEPSRA